MQDRRQNVRQKSLFRGVVYFDGNPCAIECVVRDISETGARLKFASPPPTSYKNLELQIPIKGLSYKSTTVWHAGDEIGISFLSDERTAKDSTLENRVWALENEIRDLKEMLETMQGKRADDAAKVA